ncbi:Trafficking protein particle complex subunit 6B-like protein [Drosera capensis]
MVREVSGSCVDSLLIEMVSSYADRFYATKPELAARRIESIGFQVGQQLSERYTMERPRFTDHLEAIKFICKDFWSEIFKKQIDNLKTNHRGTFVLQDNRFRWLSHMSLDPSPDGSGLSQGPSGALVENKAAQAASMHLYFPCGIIRGALSNLGIPCAVSADISNLPASQSRQYLYMESGLACAPPWFFCRSHKSLVRNISTSPKKSDPFMSRILALSRCVMLTLSCRCAI